jgi:PAS domain-containing protein
MHPSLELIFSHLSGGLLWLGADGRIKYANARARQLAGLEGRPAAARRHACEKAVAVIGSGRHDRPIDMEYLPAAGEQRLLHAQAAPAHDPG